MAITLVNLILAVVILAMGIWAYRKVKSDVPLYIGIAFGLFAISHLITLIGMASALNVFIIVIRLIAYLLIIFVLYRILVRK